jgi:hypothetical protein
MTNVAPARFNLTRRITLPGGSTKGSIQLFPWTIGSAEHLFNAKWRASDQWSSMVAEFMDAYAVVANSNPQLHSNLYILRTDSPACFPLNATVRYKT